MGHSEQLDKLAEALAKAQGTMEAAELNSTNPFFKSKYADLGSIINAAKKPLAVNGLSVAQLVENKDSQLSLTTMLMHASGQWIDSTITLPIGEEKGRSLAQTVGALTTYLRRTGYAALVGVYADEDSDGNSEAEKVTRETPRTAAPNGRQSWAASSALITRISENIPYYGQVRPHIIASLQKLGEAGKIKLEMSDDEVFGIVNRHASEEASKKAAKTA